MRFIVIVQKSSVACISFINFGLFKYYANIVNYIALYKTTGD